MIILPNCKICDDDLDFIIGAGVYDDAYGSIARAGSDLIYIGTGETGLPYIGKTSTTITARYKNIKKAPTPFTDFMEVPEALLVDVEAALIRFNGGPKSKGGKHLDNKINSTGNPEIGKRWLDENHSNWRSRFNFKKD